jgi:hypothetical protein
MRYRVANYVWLDLKTVRQREPNFGTTVVELADLECYRSRVLL